MYVILKTIKWQNCSELHHNVAEVFVRIMTVCVETTQKPKQTGEKAFLKSVNKILKQPFSISLV